MFESVSVFFNQTALGYYTTWHIFHIIKLKFSWILYENTVDTFNTDKPWND